MEEPRKNTTPIFLAWSRAGDHDPATGLAAMAYGAVLLRRGTETELWARGAEKCPDDILMHAVTRLGNAALLEDDDPTIVLFVANKGVRIRLSYALKWIMDGQRARDRKRTPVHTKDNEEGWIEAKALAELTNLEIVQPEYEEDWQTLERARDLARYHAAEALRLKQHLVRGIAETDEGPA